MLVIGERCAYTRHHARETDSPRLDCDDPDQLSLILNLGAEVEEVALCGIYREWDVGIGTEAIIDLEAAFKELGQATIV